MPLATEVGLGLRDIVLDGDPAPPPLKGHSPLQFSANVRCGQTAGWNKMPLGIQVGLGPGDFVFDRDPPTSRKKGTPTPTQFLAHVYCGQTAGWIKMPLGTEVNPYLGPGDVLDGVAVAPKRGTVPSFGFMSIVAKRRNTTWYRSRPRFRPHCIRRGPSSPRKGHSNPLFSAHFYCGQTAACIKMPLGMGLGLGPGEFVLDGDPLPPNFRPISVAAKWLHGSRCHLIWS